MTVASSVRKGLKAEFSFGVSDGEKKQRIIAQESTRIVIASIGISFFRVAVKVDIVLKSSIGK